MRKHPVDDLFKRRLSEVEKTPSSAAWQKIQANTKQERKIGGWVWYAAASVLLAIVAGYVVWNHEGSGIETIGNGRKVAKVENKQTTSPLTPLEKHSSDLEILEPNVVEEAEEIAFSKEKSSTKQKEEDKTAIAVNENLETLEINKPVENPLPVQQESIAAIKPVEMKSTADIQPVEKIDTALPEPSRTILVSVGADDLDEDKPKSKFSKVFRQLKNARAGERVDWEEVGFNPKILVAKVDDRLRSGEEKVSGKYHHLKEKTKL